MRTNVGQIHTAKLACLLLACALYGACAASDTVMGLVSVNDEGAQANAECLEIAVSADGRCVAFSSKASNLVPGDTNADWDVFLRDRASGTTERMSVSTTGAQGDGASGRPALSANGRFVAFVSDAPNLVPGDTNESQDVFVRDRLEGTTERVSVGNEGQQGDGDSGWYPSITPDGRFVVFVSVAENLVVRDDNSRSDVFIRDRQQATTQVVSVASNGELGESASGWMPAISADGRFVAFSSAANLVEDDHNEAGDVFVHDCLNGTTQRVSVSSIGAEGNANSGLARISGDATLIAFVSEASNLVEDDTNEKQDVFLYDRTTGQTHRVSLGSDEAQGDGDSEFCSMSACGRWVAFHSAASNLVAGDSNGRRDVFVRDLEQGTTALISAAPSGKPGDGDSVGPVITADGRAVVFLSFATDLVPGGPNALACVIMRPLTTGAQ